MHTNKNLCFVLNIRHLALLITPQNIFATPAEHYPSLLNTRSSVVGINKKVKYGLCLHLERTHTPKHARERQNYPASSHYLCSTLVFQSIGVALQISVKARADFCFVEKSFSRYYERTLQKGENKAQLRHFTKSTPGSVKQ